MPIAAVVVTRLPGRTDLAPRDLDSWLRQLGRTLANIHRRVAPNRLPPMEKQSWIRRRLASEDLATYARGTEMRAAIEHWISQASFRRDSLVHGDFWPANTLWLRGELTGVVDWVYACRGDAGFDVASCRLDLALLFGLRFLMTAVGEPRARAALLLWMLLFSVVSYQVTTYVRPVLWREPGAPLVESAKMFFLEHFMEVARSEVGTGG